MVIMTEPTPAQRAVGDFAPKLVELTDNVLFGDVWERPELPKRDRSLITVASLVTSGSIEQLVGHLRLAKQNGLTEAELKEAIIHLAFYAGWPKAMSAITRGEGDLRRLTEYLGGRGRTNTLVARKFLGSIDGSRLKMTRVGFGATYDTR